MIVSNQNYNSNIYRYPRAIELNTFEARILKNVRLIVNMRMLPNAFISQNDRKRKLGQTQPTTNRPAQETAQHSST